MSPYERLANAIILKAVDDYRTALHNLKSNPRYVSARHTVLEVERFFRSSWFSRLTSIDPEMLIKKINSEVL